SLADRRTEDWLLVKSPLPMLLIIAAYLAVVRYGPRLMASRQPFQLKPFLVIYNFSVAGLNLYIAGEASRSRAIQRGFKSNRLHFFLVFSTLRKYSLKLDMKYSTHVLLLKPNFFFVLGTGLSGGNFGEYPASGGRMFSLTYLGSVHPNINDCFRSAKAFIDAIKLPVGFRATARCGERSRSILEHSVPDLKVLALVQFCVGLGFGINAIFSGCKFTRWMQYAFIVYAFSFLVLFGNFYVHAYRSRVGNRRVVREIVVETRTDSRRG
ncbi:elongation of very long chain fatty acids protein, putative, partial [Ixodes scapularis]